MKKAKVSDWLVSAGVASITIGAFCINAAAGFIVGGFFAIALGVSIYFSMQKEEEERKQNEKS